MHQTLEYLKIKQTLTEIINSKIIVVGLNNPFSIMGRSFRQRVSKEIAYLSNTIGQMDLRHIYKT